MRIKGRFLRFVSFFMLMVMIHLTTAQVFAAEDQKPATDNPTENPAEKKDKDEKESVLAGRLFLEHKEDKKDSDCGDKAIPIPNDNDHVLCQKPLADTVVRIVNADTGKAYETKSEKNGCYIFRKVIPGTYSESAVHEGKEYFLADKIKIEDDQKLFACVTVTELFGDLRLLDPVTDKNKCKCKGFPFLFLLLGAGGLFAIPKGGEATPSTPE
jgi:hypothetical protein